MHTLRFVLNPSRVGGHRACGSGKVSSRGREAFVIHDVVPALAAVCAAYERLAWLRTLMNLSPSCVRWSLQRVTKGGSDVDIVVMTTSKETAMVPGSGKSTRSQLWVPKEIRRPYLNTNTRARTCTHTHETSQQFPSML